MKSMWARKQSEDDLPNAKRFVRAYFRTFACSRFMLALGLTAVAVYLKTHLFTPYWWAVLAALPLLALAECRYLALLLHAAGDLLKARVSQVDIKVCRVEEDWTHTLRSHAVPIEQEKKYVLFEDGNDSYRFTVPCRHRSNVDFDRACKALTGQRLRVMYLEKCRIIFRIAPVDITPETVSEQYRQSMRKPLLELYK